MTRAFLLSFCLCAAVCALPQPANAQSPTGTVFVTGSGFAHLRWASTVQDRGTSASGAAAGGGLGLGVHLRPRLSARVEWSMTGRIEDTWEPAALPVEPLWTMLEGALALPSTRLVVPTTFTETYEAKAAFALLGYHLYAGPVAFELLGGLGLVDERITQVTEVSLPMLPPLPGYRNEFATSTYHAAAVVGLDAAVTLAGRAALVPQVRAFALNGALHVRPGLGLRWTF